ncbi:MAG: MMPL family transporter [Nocardiaceae bacterium]|nr:MMPL family transporter [Nocardiaceae bacterium]
MLTRIAKVAHRWPKIVLIAAFLALIAAGVFGAPVASKLSSGGYDDPNSQSHRASQLLRDHFDRGAIDIVFEVIAPGGADSDGARARGLEVEDTLKKSEHSRQVTSYWSAPAGANASLKSKDGTIGLVVAEIEGTDSTAPHRGRELAETIPETRDGVTVRAGGSAMLYEQINSQSEKDLLKAEMITIPLTALVLLWVFGSLSAAALPLIVGMFAIVGTTAILRGLTMVTDVSIFAMNLTTVMGLALAIDYALFIVNRYREELSTGRDSEEALIRTVNTAGRTVLYSALTVALSLAAMAVFPMYFLRSFAYAGVAVVVLASAAAIIVAPACMTLLRRRLMTGRHSRKGRIVLEKTFWYRVSRVVMRRPLTVAVLITAAFLAVGTPFLNLNLGYPDDRVLPTSHTARVVGDDLRTKFDTSPAKEVTIVLPDTREVNDEQMSAYAAALSKVEGVDLVAAPMGSFHDGVPIGPPIGQTGAADDMAYLTVATSLDPFSSAGEDNLEALHAVPAPAETLFTGMAQWNEDNVDGIVSRLPLALGLIAGATFIVLFLFTGSVVLPIKALLMNLLSLTATFGAMVWIFQEGHLGAFGSATTGSLVANMPVLMFCIAFGISMDYEVFLLSRIREQWLSSGKTAADNERAVAIGLAHTGRIVTAAALIMAIVFSGLIFAEVSMMKLFAVGMVLAVLADATLIRGLLVPAFMKLAGRANWWAPWPLNRLHARFGLTDELPADEHERELVKV